MAPLKNCMTNQKPRKINAGNSTSWKKKKMGTSVSTRAPGNRTRYAPKTPAIAPLAPTVGTVEDELVTI